MHTFVPIMIEQGEPGYIVNTASMAGVTSLGSLAPYVASKHGVVSLSEVLVQDLAAAGAAIGVSVLCPGMVATRLGRSDDVPDPIVAAPGALSAGAPGVLSPDEVAAAEPTKEFDAKWGDPKQFLDLAFKSMWGHLAPDA